MLQLGVLQEGGKLADVGLPLCSLWASGRATCRGPWSFLGSHSTRRLREPRGTFQSQPLKDTHSPSPGQALLNLHVFFCSVWQK